MNAIDSGKNPILANDAPVAIPTHRFQPAPQSQGFPLGEQDCAKCGAPWAAPQHRTA